MSQTIGGVEYWAHQAINVYVQNTSPLIPAINVVGQAVPEGGGTPYVLRSIADGTVLTTYTTNSAGVAPAVLAPSKTFYPDFGATYGAPVSITSEFGAIIDNVSALAAVALGAQTAAEQSQLSTAAGLVLIEAAAETVNNGAGGVDNAQLTASLDELRAGLSGVNRSGTWNGTTYVMPVRQPGDVLIYKGPVSPASLGFTLAYNDEWHDTSGSV
jgi:hypothetical protein